MQAERPEAGCSTSAGVAQRSGGLGHRSESLDALDALNTLRHEAQSEPVGKRND
jgi:hypothetical protein